MAKTLASIGSERLDHHLSASGISAETLHSYGLNDVKSKDFSNVIPALIEFQSDLVFRGPIQAVKGNASPESLFVYRFERENKWSSSLFYGEAHHIIDLLYLAGVPLHYATEEPATDREISKKLIDAWVKFGNGGQPWPPYSQEQVELVIGRDGSFTLDTESKKSYNTSFRNMEREMARNPEALLRLNAIISNGTIRS